jgi:hypothetical protein
LTAPTSFDELDPDALLHIAAWLPAHDASALLLVNTMCAATIC